MITRGLETGANGERRLIKHLKPNSISYRFYKFIEETNIGLLLWFPIILGLLFMILATLLVRYFIQTGTTENYRNIIFSVGTFIAGFGGLFQIFKKEYFGLINSTRLTKIIAVINGAGLLCFFWSVSLILVIIVIFNI